MAKYWLINNVMLGTVALRAGDEIDSAYRDTSAVEAAGGILWLQGNTHVDAAAADAAAARKRGMNEAYLAELMAAGVTRAEKTQLGEVDSLNVKCATTGNITLSGAQTIDGQSAAAGDLVLVKSQTTAAENGVYEVASGAWTAVVDQNGASVLEAGMVVSVAAGTTNGGKIFVLGSDLTTWTAGTTASLSSSTPASLGVAATAGSGVSASKDDHVHAWAQKKTVTITHADLTNAVNGSAETENVGTALPAGAIVTAMRATLTTQFTGGGAAAVDVDLGWSGATEALMKNFDALGSTDGGAFYDGNDGAAAPTRALPMTASAKQLIATFTPDGGASLDGLTAGSITIDVYYVVAF